MRRFEGDVVEIGVKIDSEKSKKDLKDLSYDVIQLQKNNFNLGVEKLKTEKQKPQQDNDEVRELRRRLNEEQDPEMRFV